MSTNMNVEVAAASKQRPRMRFFVDIESSGSNVCDNFIIAIGYYADLPDNPEIELRLPHKARFALTNQGTNRIYDPDCLSQFWQKHPVVHDQLQREARPIEESLVQFMTALDRFDYAYDVTIYTDCSHYDIGFLNDYLAKFLKRGPLSTLFGKQSTFRPIVDTDSFIEGVKAVTGKTNYPKFIAFDGVKHDHFPDNDAEYNCHGYDHALNVASAFQCAHRQAHNDLEQAKLKSERYVNPGVGVFSKCNVVFPDPLAFLIPETVIHTQTEQSTPPTTTISIETPSIVSASSQVKSAATTSTKPTTATKK